MKKFTCFLVLIAGLVSMVFAQDEEAGAVQNKHQKFNQFIGINLGGAGMKLNDGGIVTASAGISYDFYFFPWLSINSGILFHQEIYLKQHSGGNRFVPEGNPFCFTIPLGIHFNIPKAEWLYAGISFAFNFPVSNSNSPAVKDFYSKNDIFYSLPVDLGFDFIRAGRGGPRLFFRITPTFYKGGVAVPVGIVLQIYNWRIYAPKVEVKVPEIEVNVPNVEVNIPPPPSTIINF